MSERSVLVALAFRQTRDPVGRIPDLDQIVADTRLNPVAINLALDALRRRGLAIGGR